MRYGHEIGPGLICDWMTRKYASDDSGAQMLQMAYSVYPR